jgi:uncharacterized protein DUF6542
MASASTADTWREPGARTGPRAPRPQAAEQVARIGRPPVPPPGRLRSTDLPPLPEHLARLGGGRPDERPVPVQPRPPAARTGRPAGSSQPLRPVQHSRPVPSSRPADRDDVDGRRRGPGPAQPRGSSRLAPAPEPGGRLRGAVAVLGVFLLTLLAAAAESYLGSGPGLVTLAALTGGTGLATLLVRRRDVVTTVVAPPLVYLAAAGACTVVFSTLDLAGAATLLVRGFPTMAIATGVGLALALIRWAARR